MSISGGSDYNSPAGTTAGNHQLTANLPRRSVAHKSKTYILNRHEETSSSFYGFRYVRRVCGDLKHCPILSGGSTTGIGHSD